jgi:hypothetical protein
MMRLGAIVLFLVVTIAPGLACSFMPDERNGNERIANEPVIFAGMVIALSDREGMVAAIKMAAK